MQQQIELGDEVKDTVTDFQGIVIGITVWLNGCRRMSVQPRKREKDGRLPSSEGFDETQLTIVKKDVIHSPAVAMRKTGGPRPEPARFADPTPLR